MMQDIFVIYKVNLKKSDTVIYAGIIAILIKFSIHGVTFFVFCIISGCIPQ